MNWKCFCRWNNLFKRKFAIKMKLRNLSNKLEKKVLMADTRFSFKIILSTLLLMHKTELELIIIARQRINRRLRSEGNLHRRCRCRSGGTGDNWSVRFLMTSKAEYGIVGVSTFQAVGYSRAWLRSIHSGQRDRSTS